MKRMIRAALLLSVLMLMAVTAAPLALAKDEPKTKEICDINGHCIIVVVVGGGGGGGQKGKAQYPACSDLAGEVKSQRPENPKKGEIWRPIKCRNVSGAVVGAWTNTATPVFMVANPAVMARSLLAQVDLDPIGIGLAPKGVDAMALVGLPVWLWVDRPSRTTWGPATISAGGVSLTARVESLTWELGDGFTVSCGKGTVWRRGMGGNPSPTCGHTYSRPGVYTVTATTHWVARWSGYGQSGTIPLDLTRSRQLTVAELQVIGTSR